MTSVCTVDWNNSSRRQQQDEDGAQKMRMRYTKRGKAFVMRNVYTHVKVGDLMRRVSRVHRDKAVLPDFARSEIPKNVAPIQTSGRFLCDKDAGCEYSSLDTHCVLSMYAHTGTHPRTHTHTHTHTHIQPTNPYLSAVNRYSCVT